MLRYRLVFGTLMIGLLLLVFWADAQLDHVSLAGTWIGEKTGRTHPPAGLLIFGLTITAMVLTSAELARFFKAKGVGTSHNMVAIAGAAGGLLVYAAPANFSGQGTLALFATVLVGVFLLSLLRHCWGGIVEGSLHAGGAAVFAFVYLGTLPGFYLLLRRWNSPWLIVALILIVKSCDIGAYFTGRAIGKHKLIPWLSPGKTWEGLAGGLVFSGLVAVGAAALGNRFPLELPPLADSEQLATLTWPVPLWYAAVAGVVMGGIGQLGDLTASLLKRDAGLKDSGSAIPGFGGLLDVVDSPIVVAPVAYWLIRMAPTAGG